MCLEVVICSESQQFQPMVLVRSSVLVRPSVVATTLLSVVAASIALFGYVNFDAALETQRTGLIQATLVPEIFVGVSEVGRSDDAGLIHSLPSQPEERRLLEVLQHAASDAQVTVNEVQFAERRAATATALGRSSVTVALRGSYAGVKAVLAEVLERVDGASVQRVSLRRAAGVPALGGMALGPGAGAESLEANWTLSLWSRPLLPPEAVLAAAPAASAP